MCCHVSFGSWEGDVPWDFVISKWDKYFRSVIDLLWTCKKSQTQQSPKLHWGIQSLVLYKYSVVGDETEFLTMALCMHPAWWHFNSLLKWYSAVTPQKLEMRKSEPACTFPMLNGRKVVWNNRAQRWQRMSGLKFDDKGTHTLKIWLLALPSDTWECCSAECELMTCCLFLLMLNSCVGMACEYIYIVCVCVYFYIFIEMYMKVDTAIIITWK